MSSTPLRWWRQADPSAVGWVFLTLDCLLVAVLLLPRVGLDRLSAMDVLSTPIGRNVMALAAVAVALISVRAWFTPPVPENEVMARYKRDRVGVWWLFGCAFALAQVAIALLCCDILLGVVAQHLHGAPTIRRALVLSIEQTYSAKAACHSRLLARDHADGRVLRICLRASFQRSIATAPLAAGQTVDIHARRTSLGLVAVAVEPVSFSPEHR